MRFYGVLFADLGDIGHFGGSILGAFGTNRRNKHAFKKVMEKGCKKGSARHAGKMVVRPVCPLKRTEFSDFKYSKEHRHGIKHAQRA